MSMKGAEASYSNPGKLKYAIGSTVLLKTAKRSSNPIPSAIYLYIPEENGKLRNRTFSPATCTPSEYIAALMATIMMARLPRSGEPAFGIFTHTT